MRRSTFAMVVAMYYLARNTPYCSCREMRGHLEPLGLQSDSDGHIDVRETMMAPAQFWDEYCSVGRPVLFKGAAANMPAITRWTDSYLTENYGDLRVKLESKYEKRRTPEGSAGMGQDLLKDFIASYRDVDKYMVSQLPGPLLGDVGVPRCLLCGTFRDRILEANVWMSSGDTKSVLHRDADNALNCLLNGTKNWILIDPRHGHLLPVAVEPGQPYGGFTLLNVDKVDLVKFPDVSKVGWKYANVSAGDCLFLPKGHWHQVRSYGEKNLAVSILVARMTEFEDYGCPKSGALPPPEALSDVPMVWTYDGYGAQTMGNTDPFELNETLSEMCDSRGRLTRDVMEEYLVRGLQVDEGGYEGTLDLSESEFALDRSNVEVMRKRADELVRLMDFDGDAEFDCAIESAHLTVPVLKRIADVMDPDPANTPDFEFKALKPDQIKDLIRSSVSCQLSKDRFLASYRKAKGSTRGANWIFEQLDPDGDGRLSLDEIQQNLSKVLRRYEEGMIRDTSMEFVKGQSMEIWGSHEKDEL